jgi:hypothetical protein
MNKQLVTLLSIVAVIAVIAVIAFTLASRNVAPSQEKSGASLEQSGQFASAMTAYSAAMLKVTDGRRFVAIPDKTTAANLNPSTWEKPIAEFVDWLFSGGKISPEMASLVSGLNRCMAQVKYENFVYSVGMKKVSVTEYKTVWKQAFSPEQNSPDAVAEKAFERNEALCTFTGNSTYSYAVSLVSLESGKRIDIQVGLDMALSFLVRPGTYFVILKSTATFQDNTFQNKREWISGFEASRLVIPDSVNVVNAYLRTEVARRAK